MRYNLIRTMDINNGPGICASLYVQGCSNHCDGCFNQATWKFTGGNLWNRRLEEQFVQICNANHIKNICILGGEPLDQDKDLLRLLKRLKNEVKKHIWLWTGYTFEDIMFKENENVDAHRLLQQQIIELCDVVVDGRFDKNLKDSNLLYRGSSNQRVIDVPESLRKHNVVIHKRSF